MKNLQGLFLSRQHNRASALVLSVWILFFFTILGVGIHSIVVSQIRLTKALQERALCPYLAKAAYFYFQKDSASAPSTLFKLKGEKELELGRGKFIYTVSDENSKININYAPKEWLVNLPGIDEELAQKILQLRASMGIFVLEEELFLVEGFNEEIFDKISGLVTVYGDGKVNINSSPREVMKVFGFDENLISSIIDFRSGFDGQEATEDDEVFQTVEQLLILPGVSESQITQINKVKEQLRINSEVSLLHIDTEILSNPAMKYEIVVEKGKVKRWREM
ncbi:MAG: hypothetical protein FJZ15_06295 [Candidatus Omnitrophica bacterium]|nr:hypothetical protein [Candidatus Omnitrophota bacterium]